MGSQLAWQDQAVILAYLGLSLLVGLAASQKQLSNGEYFLARRQLPWWAAGLSLLATLAAGVAFLADPAEVWNSGVSGMFAKLLAVPVAAAVVGLFVIPCLMRLKITSVYEYLEYRFNYPARLIGVTLFALLSAGGMTFALLSISRTVSGVAGLPLGLVIAVLGLTATAYTFLGGFRAVVWSNALQVVLMFAGGLVATGFIAMKTNTNPVDWYRAAVDPHASATAMKLVDTSPFAPPTIVTVALSLLLWQVCTQSGSQTALQRCLATSDSGAARKSFLFASLGSIALSVLLLAVGLALMHFYTQGHGILRPQVDPLNAASAFGPHGVFPAFVIDSLPPGLSGLALVAVLAAVMSVLDTGIHSLATAFSMERGRREPRSRYSPGAGEHPDDDSLLGSARATSLIVGLIVTIAAFALPQFAAGERIFAALPRGLGCIAAALGGMFLIGILLPFVTGRAIVPATLLGLFAGVALSFSQELFGLKDPISATWVMPGALWSSLLFAAVFSLLDRPRPQQTFGLTCFTQHQEVLWDVEMMKTE